MIIQDPEGFGFGACWWMMTVVIVRSHLQSRPYYFTYFTHLNIKHFD